jgi:UDP:flavonoid glycosyltransferase YjiC (YdhE family)
MLPPCTFAHVLNNRVFGSSENVRPIVSAWRLLIADVKPDLILFDHCPSGMLASRGLNLRRATIGTGFTCPPAVSPFPNWRVDLGDQSAKLQQDEQHVLNVVNDVMTSIAGPPLRALADLYSQVDAVILKTYPELDHYGARPNTDYYGAWPLEWGNAPQWPATSGKKVFAYLKESPELQTVLAVLGRLNLSSVVFCPTASDDFIRNASSPNVRIERSPLKMSAAVAGCDFAILNGTHTSIVQMLRGGKPVISIPLVLEQQLTGTIVAQLPAGVCLPDATPANVEAAIKYLPYDNWLAEGARRFAEKYAADSAPHAVARITDRLTSLL